VFTLTIPPNSSVEVDPDIRLIAVNTKEGEQYTRSWLHRLDWIRRCKDDDGPQTCDVDFGLALNTTVHDDGLYQVVDASHVVARGRQYELRRDAGAMMLLNPDDVQRAHAAFEDAKLARASFAAASATTTGAPVDPARSRMTVCDRIGPYVALLTTEKNERKFDAVRIVDGTGNKTCQDYADERNVIMSFDLRSYSIRDVAFARGTRSIVPTDNVPDHIYLQGDEPAVIYSLAWKPAKIRSMLCETLSKQRGQNIPPLSALADDRSISPVVQLAVGKKDGYANAEICRD
jgi:hypothetical protein